MKLNISIDDVTPWRRAGVRVLKHCFTLIQEFPDIKFTLFVPTAYYRPFVPTNTDQVYFLNNFPEFCKIMRDLPKNNFEIGFHGHFHGVPNKSNNDEFLHFKDINEIYDRVRAMKIVAEDSGIPFKNIFRPPAWKLHKDAPKVLKDNGIEIIAGHQNYPYTRVDGVKDLYESCSPPIKPLTYRENNVIVYHACEWDSNVLDFTSMRELYNYIKIHEDDFEFCFMGDF